MKPEAGSARKLTSTLFLLTALLFLALAVPIPIAHASTGGPFGYYIITFFTGYNIDNTYQAYPGGTFFINYYIVNSQTSGSMTITQIQVTTPWATYSDSNLPLTVGQGDYYWGYFEISIPSSGSPGNYTVTITDSTTGYNLYSGTFHITVFDNPAALQTEISGLNSQISSLQSQVSSLQSQLSAAKNNQTSLQSQVTSLQSQAATLQSQLTTAKNNATNIQTSLSLTKAQLSTSQSELSNETAKVNTLSTELQSTQADLSNKTAAVTTLSSQLSTTKANLATASSNLAAATSGLAVAQGEVTTYSSFYLPVGIAVPSVVAILLLVLYLRKSPKSAGGAIGMPISQAMPTAAQATAQSSSKFCSECGAENKVGAKFCAKCGAGLS